MLKSFLTKITSKPADDNQALVRVQNVALTSNTKSKHRRAKSDHIISSKNDQQRNRRNTMSLLMEDNRKKNMEIANLRKKLYDGNDSEIDEYKMKISELENTINRLQKQKLENNDNKENKVDVKKEWNDLNDDFIEIDDEVNNLKYTVKTFKEICQEKDIKISELKQEILILKQSKDRLKILESELYEKEMTFLRYKQESENEINTITNKYNLKCKEFDELSAEIKEIKIKKKKKNKKPKQRATIFDNEGEQNIITKIDIISSEKEDKENWSIGQLLRSWQSLKNNSYNNLMEYMLEMEELMNINNNIKYINIIYHFLFDILIESYTQNISILLNERKGNVNNIVCQRFAEYYQIWKLDEITFKPLFEKYIAECLKISEILHHFKLKLYPKEFNHFAKLMTLKNMQCDLEFNDDIMIKEMLQERENKNDLYCSFPAIVNDKDMNKTTMGYDHDYKINHDQYFLNQHEVDINAVIKSKLWIFNQ